MIRPHGASRSTTTWVHCAPRTEDRRLTDVAEKEQEGTEYRKNAKKEVRRMAIKLGTESETRRKKTRRHSQEVGCGLCTSTERPSPSKEERSRCPGRDARARHPERDEGYENASCRSGPDARTGPPYPERESSIDGDHREQRVTSFRRPEGEEQPTREDKPLRQAHGKGKGTDTVVHGGTLRSRADHSADELLPSREDNGELLSGNA